MSRTGEICGRDFELAAVDAFLDALDLGSEAEFLLIEGEAGLGKTTVWRAGVREARERLYWVLVSRPAEAETKMSYAALGDLLEPVLEDALPKLPDPQRRAIEIALLRRETETSPPQPRALGVALHNLVRELSEVAPVLVALDDVQWLDSASARVLDFALRRLEQSRVGVLATRRLGDRCAELTVLEAAGRVRIGELDADSLDGVVRSRLGRGFPPPLLHRLHAASRGNPFFALEIARALDERRDEIQPGEPLPIPDDLNELVLLRLRRLPEPTQAALVAVSALSRPTRSIVAAALGEEPDLEPAEKSAIVAIHGDTIEFDHPLFAAALYASLTSTERRRLHRRLAELVGDREEQARHLALATDGPDEDVAAALERAATTARARGAPETAAELCEQAWRLTPTESVEEVQRRKIEAAEDQLQCGDLDRARQLLDEAAGTLPPGSLRARSLLMLGLIDSWGADDWESGFAKIEKALLEIGEDDRLRADTERRVGWAYGAKYRPSDAEPHLRAAVGLAERLDDRVLLAEALAAYANIEFQLGRGFRRELTDRALALETLHDHSRIFRHPNWPLHKMLLWSADFDGARACLETLFSVAQERGEEWAPARLLAALSQVERAAGNWDAAMQLASRAHAAAVQTGQETSRRAAVAAGAAVEALWGDVAAVRRNANDWLAAEPHGLDADDDVRMTLGFLELSLGRTDDAARYLAPLLGEARIHGVDDPSVFPFWADAIEALVGCRKLEQAESVLAWLEERGQTLGRPWALATAGRCRALLSAAHADVTGALASVEQALREHERLPQQFELARTLLIKGKIARRAKQKRAAREALERALGLFDGLGAALWSKQTHEELSRIGGRSPSRGLTPTQERIVELVSRGHTNREVAEALFVTVKTVEANLSKIYRKVGVSSRRELARKVEAAGTEQT
jgi:DNA-binding CsgD family transcriptional regulator